MRPVIIIGTTSFSAMFRKIIETEKYKVLGFSTRRAFCMGGGKLEGLDVFPFEDLASHFDMKEVQCLNTIGYSQMNGIRAKMFLDILNAGYDNMTFISSRANVYSNEIGQGSIIMPGAFVGPDVKLGTSCVVYSNVSLTHHISVGNYCFIGSGTVVGGGTRIENNCFLGLNSTIKNRIHLAPYTLVGSGSNVIRSVDSEACVCVGNPAKVIEGKKSLEIKSI